MEVIARQPDCGGQAAAVSAVHSSQKKEDTPILLRIPKSECPDFGHVFPRHRWPTSWSNNDDPVVPLERNLYGHSLAGLFVGKDSSQETLLELGWEREQNWECFFVHRKQGLFLSVYVDDKNDRKEAEKGSHVEDIEERRCFWWTNIIFLIMYTWYCTQRECTPNDAIVEQYQEMFESRLFCWSNGKLPGGTNFTPKLLRCHTTWKVMLKNALNNSVNGQTRRPSNCGKNLTQSNCMVLWTWKGHAQKCVERYCELANKRNGQLHKVSSPCLDDHHVKKEELESVRELSKVCSQIVLECLYLARIGRPDIPWSVNNLARSGHQMGTCLWQTIGKINFIHSSRKKLQSTLSCG